MLATLMGPDDLGYWFLTDDDGISFPLVQRRADLPGAASLFGWKAPEGMEDRDDLAENARLWLMDHISDEIEAPKDVVEYFQQFGEDEGND
jgi:hypothetical protein